MYSATKTLSISDCRYIFFSRLPGGKSLNLVLCTASVQRDAYHSAEGTEQISYTNWNIGINKSNIQALLAVQELPFYSRSRIARHC